MDGSGVDSLASAITPTPTGLDLRVRVLTRARGRPGAAGLRAGALLVRLSSPAIDGRANAELIALLSAWLDVPARALHITHGGRSRSKRIRIDGLTGPDLIARLSVRLTRR